MTDGEKRKVAEMEARHEKTAAWLRNYCGELYAEIKRLREIIEKMKAESAKKTGT